MATKVKLFLHKKTSGAMTYHDFHVDLINVSDLTLMSVIDAPGL